MSLQFGKYCWTPEREQCCALAEFEIRNLFGRNRDGFTRLWVASLAGLSLPMTKATKAAQLDLFAGIERLHDTVENGLNHQFSFLFGQPAVRGNFNAEIGFGHVAGRLSEPIRWVN